MSYIFHANKLKYTAIIFSYMTKMIFNSLPKITDHIYIYINIASIIYTRNTHIKIHEGKSIHEGSWAWP